MIPISVEVCGESTTIFLSEIERDTYFVLGMLEEYGERIAVDGSGRVEGFYGGEQFHGYVMAAYLSRIARNLEFNDDLEIKRKQKSLVILHSRKLSEYLNSFYNYSYSAKAMHENESRRVDIGNLEYSSFENRSNATKYSYLAGAYFRFGTDDRFHFTNGKKKAELTSRLLEDLGCSKPVISVKRGLPYSIFVDFSFTEELRDWINRYPEDWAVEMVDSFVGTASDDEIAIYHSVISSLRKGMIENCYFSFPCHVSRLSNIHGYRDTNIPGLPAHWQEALDDHNAKREEFISLIGLASDSIHVHNVMKYNVDGCKLGLTRIGFNEKGDHAIAIVAFRCSAQEGRGSRVALFLNKQNGEWEVAQYTIQNRGRPKPDE